MIMGTRRNGGVLLESGVDVNRSGAPWSTPLAWAQKKNNVEVEKILHEAGAK